MELDASVHHVFFVLNFTKVDDTEAEHEAVAYSTDPHLCLQKIFPEYPIGELENEYFIDNHQDIDHTLEDKISLYKQMLDAGTRNPTSELSILYTNFIVTPDCDVAPSILRCRLSGPVMPVLRETIDGYTIFVPHPIVVFDKNDVEFVGDLPDWVDIILPSMNTVQQFIEATMYSYKCFDSDEVIKYDHINSVLNILRNHISPDELHCMIEAPTGRVGEGYIRNITHDQLWSELEPEPESTLMAEEDYTAGQSPAELFGGFNWLIMMVTFMYGLYAIFSQ